jgi:hypothetical protein
MGGVFFIPESPRYLIANGREEEAIAFLVKYHGNGNPESRLVLLEVEEMRQGIRLDGIDKSYFDCKFYRSGYRLDVKCVTLDRPLFFTHSGRWRLAQVVMISVFGQFSGNGLGYFNTVIFEQLGIQTVSQQLGYNLLNAVLSAIGALTAVSLTDRMPRRKVLVFGTLGKKKPQVDGHGIRRDADTVIFHSLCRGACHQLGAFRCYRLGRGSYYHLVCPRWLGLLFSI